MTAEFRYVDESHEYFLGDRKLISVTEVLSGMGLVDLRSVPKEKLERAQKFGKALHYATALDELGKLDENSITDEILRNHLESWRLFKKENGYSFRAEEIEQKMYHPIYQFAGTPDRFQVQGKELHIIDIKTSTTMYPSTALQTGGYELLVLSQFPRFNPKKIVRLGVQTGDDGLYHKEVYKEITDKTVFLGYFNAYKWELSHNIRREWRVK